MAAGDASALAGAFGLMNLRGLVGFRFWVSQSELMFRYMSRRDQTGPTEEPLRSIFGWNYQRPDVQALCVPWTYLGPVPGALLRSHLLIRIWKRGQFPALVCGFGRAGVLLPVRADGRGDFASWMFQVKCFEL